MIPWVRDVVASGLGLVAIIGLLGTVALILSSTLFLTVCVSAGLVLSAMILWKLFRFQILYRLSLRGSVPPPRQAAIEFCPSEETFQVHVLIRYKGALTGLDDGLAAFVDGWLYLEGRRATFSLHAADGKAHWRDGVLRAAFEDGQSVEVRFADGPPGTFRFFAHAAAIWAAERNHPEGEPVRPPLATQTLIRTGWRAIHALAVLGALLLALLTFRFALAGPFLVLNAAFLLYANDVLVRQREADRCARSAQALNPGPSSGRHRLNARMEP